MLCRGDIYYADLSPIVGCEQGGVRPVLIIQNNVGNRYSPTVIVAAVTSRMEKHPLPTHVFISRKYGLQKNSIIMLEQIRTIDKIRLFEYIGHLDCNDMRAIDASLRISLDVNLKPEGIFLEERQKQGWMLA
ncbi:type II toxin-antitoxin system PemK/MazF family toxin [Enterocloster bolteae]|uniref:type II toxin-antitoxin system PemK/MazF family toxin n=1 Tax=Enterocloster bolteae TaxID=208479 RepID=UPI000467B31E|nr:type II toxin-antitoxin system PemK/MazF family toxin [Enterocloster bolteae]UOX68018.1 type II toxin-antitoxin system PemK/MazF family toxin [Enterocloster bolteae]